MTQNCAFTAINLGGEGETQGVINQQPPFALSPGWASCIHGHTLEQLANQGLDFLICRNQKLPIQDDSMALVITNSVPIDTVVLGSPGVQTSEVHRVLAPGGRWVHDGNVRYTKP